MRKQGANKWLSFNLSSETVPGCFGLYGAPIAPNGPCEACGFRKACKWMLKGAAGSR